MDSKYIVSNLEGCCFYYDSFIDAYNSCINDINKNLLIFSSKFPFDNYWYKNYAMDILNSNLCILSSDILKLLKENPTKLFWYSLLPDSNKISKCIPDSNFFNFFTLIDIIANKKIFI